MILNDWKPKKTQGDSQWFQKTREMSKRARPYCWHECAFSQNGIWMCYPGKYTGESLPGRMLLHVRAVKDLLIWEESAIKAIHVKTFPLNAFLLDHSKLSSGISSNLDQYCWKTMTIILLKVTMADMSKTVCFDNEAFQKGNCICTCVFVSVFDFFWKI